MIIDGLSALLQRKPDVLKKCVAFIKREVDVQKQPAGSHYGTRSVRGGTSTSTSGSAAPTGRGAVKAEAPGVSTRSSRRGASAEEEGEGIGAISGMGGYGGTSASGGMSSAAALAASIGAATTGAIGMGSAMPGAAPNGLDMQNAEVINVYIYLIKF